MSAVATKFPRDERASGVRVSSHVAPSTKMVTSLADWAKTAKSKEERKKAGIQKASLDRAEREMNEMIEREDYTGAKPMHVFVLYAMLHKHVYGVEASEAESPGERKKAIMFIGSTLRSRFDGDVAALIAFVRWVWAREERTEKWRRETRQTNGRRLGCYLAFSPRLYTDYKVARERALASR